MQPVAKEAGLHPAGRPTRAWVWRTLAVARLHHFLGLFPLLSGLRGRLLGPLQAAHATKLASRRQIHGRYNMGFYPHCCGGLVMTSGAALGCTSRALLDGVGAGRLSTTRGVVSAPAPDMTSYEEAPRLVGHQT